MTKGQMWQMFTALGTLLGLLVGFLAGGAIYQCQAAMHIWS